MAAARFTRLARGTSFRFATFVSASQTPAKKERYRGEKKEQEAGRGAAAAATTGSLHRAKSRTFSRAYTEKALKY